MVDDADNRMRLESALKAAEIATPHDCDLDDFAADVDSVFAVFKAFGELESSGKTRAQREQIEAVFDCATQLADSLKNPYGRVAFHLEKNFDASKFAAYGLQSPLELQKMLKEIADAAEKSLKRDSDSSVDSGPFDVPALDKTKGQSPTLGCIAALADIYEQYCKAPARVERVDAEGTKGGQFPAFVDAAFKEWRFSGSSIHNVAKALRGRKSLI